MKTIAFVIPWFGFDIPGGAEMELKGLVSHLHDAGVKVEILTTCVKEFTSSWSVNHYKQKAYVENGITVRRFKVKKQKTDLFNTVNKKLMSNDKLTPEEEKIFTDENVNSPNLYKYIAKHKEDYDLFVFIPYMFGTTYHGIQQCIDRAVMIPCFHDESYIYMDRFKEAFSKVAGMIFHARPEMELASKVYDLSNVDARELGEGVYTDYEYDAERFREKYNIDRPFILYAGRKDIGKNIYTLIYYFEEYKKTHHFDDLKLVLIGGGKVNIPARIKDHVYDLGYVPMQDKYDAYAAATVMCQPSKFESFSLVVMESWICETPVLVHNQCNVTKYFASDANGGFYFDNYREFEAEIEYLLSHPEECKQMGENGRKYVLDKFAWNVIVDKYTKYFQDVIDRRKK